MNNLSLPAANENRVSVVEDDSYSYAEKSDDDDESKNLCAVSDSDDEDFEEISLPGPGDPVPKTNVPTSFKSASASEKGPEETSGRTQLPRRNSVTEGDGQLNMWQHALNPSSRGSKGPYLQPRAPTVKQEPQKSMFSILEVGNDQNYPNNSEDAISGLLAVRTSPVPHAKDSGGLWPRSDDISVSTNQAKKQREASEQSPSSETQRSTEKEAALPGTMAENKDSEDEEERTVANLLSKSMQRTDSALSTSDFPLNGSSDGSLKRKRPKEDLVRLRGVWNNKTWTGEWYAAALANVKAEFKYTPNMTQDIDEEMEDQPCSVCNESSAVNFLFCDLCNLGFHAKCAGEEKLPAEEEDWHCQNCVKVLKRYGNSLPPSRSWVGWFYLVGLNGKLKSVKETFKLAFHYTIIDDAVELTEDTVQVGTFTGKGLNKFGTFIINGTLQKAGEEYIMECDKTYVETPKKRRGPKPFTHRKKSSSPSALSTARAQTPTSETQLSSKGSTTPAGSDQRAKRAREVSPANTVQLGTGPRPYVRHQKLRELEEQSKVDRALIQELQARVLQLTEQLDANRRTRKTLIMTDGDCMFPASTLYVPSTSSIWLAYEVLRGSPDMKKQLQWFSDPPKAEFDVLFDAHDMQYVLSLFRQAREAEDDHLDLYGALKACGGTCTAIDMVSDPAKSDENFKNAICVLRPPGHRVGRRGFTEPEGSAQKHDNSVLNHVAVGAIHAHQKYNSRIAIIDLSVLGGTGTEEVLLHYSNEFPASQAGSMFYGSVEWDEHSSSRTFPSMNVEGVIAVETSVHRLKRGSGSETWRLSVVDMVKKLRAFRPSLILVSMGFEGLVDNPSYGKVFDLCPEDYLFATRLLTETPCPLVSFFEGVYVTKDLSLSLKLHYRNMLGLVK
eukprot:CAMPEP_0184519950 /NCGR_PEP_ID=MMETSP0198_2-20121128/6902_1 /TAXON_ID=1112570 /ORGANISM="Thraustochytrium sp., Strain LLF1b" /LENGTH=895 /DNA_ID=CAMNT_0026910505 /DNA_START=318 /DNA_END=3005 /DNA_ORIENTATION=-